MLHWQDDNFFVCKAPFFSVITEKDKQKLMRMEEILRYGLLIENVFVDHETLHKLISASNDEGQ